MENFGQISGLVLGSSLLSAFLTEGWKSVGAYWKSKKDAGFSALYAALALEAYADKCSSLISESNTYEGSSGYAGEPHSNVAELPEYPKEIDWKALEIKETTTLMNFRVDVETTRSMIRGAWEFEDEDTLVPQTREEAGRLGILALQLADTLRSDHSIKAAHQNKNWDMRKYLKDNYAQEVKTRKDRENRYKKAAAAAKSKKAK